jgi:DNA-binding HxlR family transcriptional regulator
MSAPRGNGASARNAPELPLPSSDVFLIERARDALDVLVGKWKVGLLFLMARGVHRHSKLLECLPGASKKVMTDSLRALERDGLVDRNIHAEVPLRVDYSLTPLGWTLAGPLIALSEWGEAHAEEVVDARRHADDRPTSRRSRRRAARPVAA